MALTLPKRLLMANWDADLTTILKQELSFIKMCFRTKDVKEEIQAFAEKRKPIIKGE